MVKFTDAQNKQLGKLFPDPPGTKPEDTLLAKFTTLLRDAILGAQAFVTKVKEIVAEVAPTKAEFEELKRQVNTLTVSDHPVDRLRKDILGGDYKIPDDFRSHLENHGDKAEDIRRDLEAYNQARRKMINIDKALVRRSFYPNINEMAGKVAMGQLTMEEAEQTHRGPVPNQPVQAGVGTAEDATVGLRAAFGGGA